MEMQSQQKWAHPMLTMKQAEFFAAINEAI